MITDADYLLEQLRAHPNGRDAMQVISASIRDRGVGLTVHSRAASLRDQGYVISCGIEGKTRKGRERYVYRLVSEPVLAGGGVVPVASEPSADSPSGGFVEVASAGQAHPDAGVVDPPARVEQEPQQGQPTAAPLDAPIPGQLRLIA